MQIASQSSLHTPQCTPAAPHAGRAMAQQQLPGRKPARNGRGMLFAMLVVALGAAGVAGCAAPEKKPLTITEWMQQPRVGESAR